MQADTRRALRISVISAFLAGLCCFSPVVLVLLGLGTASFAGGLADTLYGEYKWYFRGVGTAFLAGAYLWWYWTSTQGCTLDQKKRQRRKLINLFLISAVVFILGYIVWLYGAVDIFGIWLGIW